VNKIRTPLFLIDSFCYWRLEGWGAGRKSEGATRFLWRLYRVAFSIGHSGDVALRRGWESWDILAFLSLSFRDTLLFSWASIVNSIFFPWDKCCHHSLSDLCLATSLSFFLVWENKRTYVVGLLWRKCQWNINIWFLRGFSKEITSIYFHEDESYSETSKIRTLFYVNRTYANYSDLRLPNRCFHHLLSIFLNVYFSSYSIFHFSLPKILEV